MKSTTLLTLLSSLGGLQAAILPRQFGQTATVDLSKTTGQARALGSGWIYGFPDNGVKADNSIPENFIRDIKFKANRAGGAQTPFKGWYAGYDAYVGRLNSTISNYRTTRKYGGDFILLVHDIWGADGATISKYPGDNGDWSSMEAFLTQLIKDIKANNMLDGLVIDLWNEPELQTFWGRSWSQYLQYYVRAHRFFKQQLPNTLISGPSAANAPRLNNNNNWKTWLSTIAGNNTIPDIYSWHQISSAAPDITVSEFKTLKAANKLPDRPIDVNEYAWPEEQTPACTVWYLAQLERNNLRGLRAHWGSTTALHNDLANLVFRDGNKKYQPTGEWQLYKYYANMVGERVATTSSNDRNIDVFATKSVNTAKIIAGTHNIKGSYSVKVSGLASLGLGDSGSANVRVYRFDWAGSKGYVGAPVNLGVSAFAYKGGSMTISVNPSAAATAYAYEIVGRS